MVGLGEYALVEWTGVDKQGVTTKFYGLESMNIAPLRGRIDLSTKVWVQSLGSNLGRC